MSLVGVGLLRGEGSDVLLYEGTEGSFVDITYEVEFEATSVSEAATEELEHTIVVHALDFFDAEWVALRVVGEDVARDGVAEEGERVSLACLDLADGTLLPCLEGVLVSTYSCEVEVEELEHRLEVFLRRATCYIIADVGDRRRDRSDATAEGLLES